MPLHDLLYRCPRCGHDPTTATARGAECPECGTTFEQGPRSQILVHPPQGPTEEAHARALMDEIDRFGGPESAALDDESRLVYEARVGVQHAGEHKSVWWKRKVVGFYEVLGEPREGVLQLDGETIEVSVSGNAHWTWPLDDVLAIQISSRALQINVRGEGLWQYTFREDSPRRWEDLLELALTRFHAARGREVLEFQPMVVTRDAR